MQKTVGFLVAQMLPKRGFLHKNEASRPSVTYCFRTPRCETGKLAKPLLAFACGSSTLASPSVDSRRVVHFQTFILIKQQIWCHENSGGPTWT